MGRWNRRYLPRKKYNYQYQDYPPHTYESYDDESHPVIQENSVPKWEIEFCKSAGVPWGQVVNIKKYISFYDNVAKWDDSASQEAFDDAKSRYWAKINGLPFDNPLPNPHKYVDEVDWDAKVDPELILDLDREFFNPDEAKVIDLVEDTSGCTPSNGENRWEIGQAQGTGSVKAGPDNNGENPWEIGHSQGTGALKAGQSWAQWDDSKNVENPWEENHTRTGGEPSRWKGVGNDSWGRDHGHNASSGPHNNAWNHDSGNARQKEWGGNNSNKRNSFLSRNTWNDPTRNSWIDRDHKQWNSGNYSDPRQNDAPRSGQRNNNNNSRSWRNSGSQINHQPMYLESERSNSGRESSFYGGSRKRECSSYHTSRFKSSRFQGDEQWRKI